MKAGARVKIGRKVGVGATVSLGRRTGIGAGVKVGKRSIRAGAGIKL